MSQPSRIQVIEQILVANRGKLLGVLVRLLGTQHYELVEDIIQDVWLKAFSHWQASGLPDEPSAWLITVAKRTALDALRAQKVRQKYADSLTEPLTSEWTVASTVEKAFDSQLFVDDELRLLFWLSSTDMPQQSRLPLVLKTLCGLDANAVSRALLLPLETVKKRLVRAKKAIQATDFVIPHKSQLPNALQHVHLALYLMFNEAVNQEGPDLATRGLITTTVRGYVKLILQHSEIASSGSYALMAIIQFHLARWQARFDEQGVLISIDEQVRGKWHTGLFIDASLLLEQALDMQQTGACQRFVLEALIMYEHGRAKSYAVTQWSTIVDCYVKWYQLEPTPPVAINLAVAYAQNNDVKSGLSLLDKVDSQYSPAVAARVLATRSFIYALSKDADKARDYCAKAVAAGLTDRALAGLNKQLEKLLDG